MYCPKCLKQTIEQISKETIHYDTEAGKVLKIAWDSDYQEFKCGMCGHNFNGDQAREIQQQVDGVWRYLCKKHGWSESDVYNKNTLTNTQLNRKDWDELWKAVWNEKLGYGEIEWEWTVIYTATPYGTTSDGAVSYTSGNLGEPLFMNLEGVRWNPSWQWLPTESEMKEMDEVERIVAEKVKNGEIID